VSVHLYTNSWEVSWRGNVGSAARIADDAREIVLLSENP
jgi:hypothetical protein